MSTSTAGQPYRPGRRGFSVRARRALQTAFLAALVLLALACGEPAAAPRSAPVGPACGPVEPPLAVIQFFDWYARDEINGPHWTHRVAWSDYGLDEAEVGSSRAYYDSQLDLIEGLGVDGIVYEYFDERLNPRFLSPAFLASLEAHELEIGLFYDLELERVQHLGPVLAQEPYIRPTPELAQQLVDRFTHFYRQVPEDRWLVDREGRLPIMVFGFGFDREAQDAAAWTAFYRTISEGVEQTLGLPPVVYWTASNAVQLELAFQRFPDRFRPFNFVLDTPQHQLAPGAVTWNVNFDNLGVQRHYGFLRVVRDDPRYLEEMLWLAKATAPELLFIYSWNEYYEGANVMPDETYGTRRYELVRAMLEDVRENGGRRLPCTLLVVDDYADAWASEDWRLDVAEQFTLYPLRRLAPGADVVLAEDATPELVAAHELVVVVSQSPEAVEAAAEALDRTRVVFVGPALAADDDARGRFASAARRVEHNAEARLVLRDRELGGLFVRDDVLLVRPAQGVATTGRIVAEEWTAPALLRRGDDWWLNAFSPDDRLLAPLFQALYERPLEPGIMHGEALASQRLEIEADGTVRQNTFSAPAAFEHEPLPVPWDPPPPPALPGS